MIFRSALRALGARPGFVLATVVMLAVGVGGTTAIYSVVYHLILYPLPVDEPERLVWVWKTREGMSFSMTPSWEEVQLIQDADQLEGAEALRGSEVLLKMGDGPPESERAALVSPTFFDLAGASPERGRRFRPDDTEMAALPVVIVSHEFWRGRLGGTDEAIGRPLMLGSVAHEIIGVMPAGFHFPYQEAPFWLPLKIDPANPPRGLNILARLAPGVSAEQANAQLDGILAAASPTADPPWTARLNSLADMLGSSTVQVVWLLLVAVGLVLVIACANVANLILVHGNSRTPQLAIRSALGAGRRVLIGQLLLESLLLAALGGVAGLVVAFWGLDLIRALRPDSLPELVAARIDWPILTFSLGVSALSGLVAGLIPALRLSRPDVGQMVKALSSASTTVRNMMLRRSLIVAEVALGTLLLLGAGTLVSNFTALQSADPGYRPAGLLSVRVSLPPDRYASETERVDFMRRLQGAIENIGGVDGVAAGTLPSEAGIGRDSFEIEGRGRVPGARVIPALFAGQRYFRVAGIPLVAGTGFSADEGDEIIVGHHLARTYFPEEEAVGQRIRLSPQGSWQTIVGVADDVRAFGLQDSLQRPVVYYQTRAGANPGNELLVRTGGDTATTAAAIAQRIAALDPELAIPEIAPAERILSRGISRQRFSTVLFSLFSFGGALLACLGLYGLVSYVVAERTWEIGLRMALGARRGNLLVMVVRNGLGVAAIGMGIGLLGFYWLSRLLVSWLFDVRSVDPLAAAAGLGLLLAAVTVAVLVPAARAASVDPSVALRIKN